MTEIVVLITAIFSFLAAAAAAVAAWRMPRKAAQFAEALRRDGDQSSEKKRMKLLVFAQLMQERATVYSEDGVKALNLIDIVFNDSEPVRAAWAELYLAFQMTPLIDHIIDERLRRLLAAMAENVGLADKLRIDDIGRVYHPTAIAQDRMIKNAQRQHLWDSLQGKGSPASNTQTQEGPFPPKPDTDAER